MNNGIRRYNRIGTVLLFIVLPVLIYVLGDFPRRTFLKETLSVVTIIAFFFLLLQFFMSRANRNFLREGHKMGRVIKWHKVLGYVFVGIILLHPFFIVLPRYFESGIEPGEAFVKLITTTETGGIILGIIAWILLLIIGLTSVFRNKIGLSYKTWRYLHGILSLLFIGIASFHVIDMGRHINTAMTVLIAALAISGATLLLKLYFFKSEPLKTKENE